jgi:transposase
MGQKNDVRRLSREAQEVLRKRVVMAVEKKGMLQTEAVRVFDVSLSSITQWVRKYRKEGLRALDKQVQGRPKQSGKLKGHEAAWVVRAITDKCPDQLKLPWGLWTREAVRALIERKFGLKLSISSTSRLLKKWGFTPQKPIRRALQRDPEAIKYWMRNTYPAIHKQAKVENAQIFWGDEMGVRSDDQVGRTYGRRGQTPVVTRTAKRFGCNMISAIANSGNCRFMIYEEAFTVDVFLKFTRKLIHNQDRKVVLIIDNHKVHHAKKVTEWLHTHKEKIQVYFLPPYAPELNPDELLNQDVKANASKHNKPANALQLKSALRSYLKKVQKLPQKVQSFFNKKELDYILSCQPT